MIEFEEKVVDSYYKLTNNNFMEGYKTWVGLGMTFLGFVGLGYLITATQLGDLIDSILKIVGICLSMYGNLKAHQQIDKLGGY